MHDYWARKEMLYTPSAVASRQESIITGPILRFASIVEASIVDGPGMRFVVFSQGCPHRCPGCHNPQTHLSIGGRDVSVKRLLEQYDQQPYCRGITLSGGEPFEQAQAMAILAKSVHERGGDVVTYSGYRMEQLGKMAADNSGIKELLEDTDLLVDGRFILSRRCLELPFVGSLNQRLIALSARGNRLLEDIAVLEEGPRVERIYH